MRPVTSKIDFVRRYQAGEFGNRAPTWDHLSEWERDPMGIDQPDGCLFHIRNRIAGGPTWYNLTRDQLVIKWRKLENKGKAYNLYISSMAPHQHNAIQGEIRQSGNHYDLIYSLEKGIPMRNALQRPRYATGTIVHPMLQHHFDPWSYEWMLCLLEDYPDHVLEFSCFNVNWGTIPGRNVVWWEVRPDRLFGVTQSRFTEHY